MHFKLLHLTSTKGDSVASFNKRGKSVDTWSSTDLGAYINVRKEGDE